MDFEGTMEPGMKIPVPNRDMKRPINPKTEVGYGLTCKPPR
jgi:hypothetical protein